MEKTAKLTFCGGTGTVTGANFLLEVGGKKILIDCGLTQGFKIADDVNWGPFIYDPREIDLLFVTHAHVDHLGRIPKLIAEGYSGKIYSTLPTRDLARPMLEDTANILNKSGQFHLDKIYSEENINTALSFWQGFQYHQEIKIGEEIERLEKSGNLTGMVPLLADFRNLSHHLRSLS